MSGIEKRWPGESDEAHPEIFKSIPPQPEILKPGQVTKEKVEQFFDEVNSDRPNNDDVVLHSRLDEPVDSGFASLLQCP